ncbi:MAG: hypothetical protein PHP23_07845 [Desulfobacterales bacterium]|nr:hypothetical protein [Desulfobacterales bacterium]MDD4393694.1 hypothetical protein [Desulfobacterales bacterium]
MNTHLKAALCALLVLTAAMTAIPRICAAQEKQDMGGWETNSPYNQLYSPVERDEFKGVVSDIREVVPLSGMSPAVALVILDSGSELITVHLGPRWFIDPGRMGIKKGDKVKIKGAWAEINGEDIFMASKVKKGDYFEFKVRLTQDGTPFWTMTPEEFARENAPR